MSFFNDFLKDGYKPDLTHQELEVLIEAKVKELTKERDAFKQASDKNASEAADYKKKYSEKLTEAEKKQLEYDEIIKQNKELVKNADIAKYTGQYLSLGYEEALARETALAQVEGNFDKVFENQKKFNQIVNEKHQKELLEKTPKPNGGSGGAAPVTKEQFAKMSIEERLELHKSDPATYNKFMSEK